MLSKIIRFDRFARHSLVAADEHRRFPGLVNSQVHILTTIVRHGPSM